MKPLISYKAQKGCLRLSEFIKEKEEISPEPPKEEREMDLSGCAGYSPLKSWEVMELELFGIKIVKNLNKRHGK